MIKISIAITISDNDIGDIQRHFFELIIDKEGIR